MALRVIEDEERLWSAATSNGGGRRYPRAALPLQELLRAGIGDRCEARGVEARSADEDPVDIGPR